jgi:O-antigen ligase
MHYLHHGGARRLLGALYALAVMSLLGSRASMLASLAGLLLTSWSYLYTTRTPGQSSSRRRLAVLGVAPFVLVALLVALPQTTSGSKLLVSFGIKPAESSFDQAGIGTKEARTHTWDRLIAYTERTTSRRYVGVGFGPNIMLESGGSLALLSGEIADVRSPHNYFLGSYARLGRIGIILLALLVLSMLGGIWRVRRLAGADDLLLLATLIPPMILIEATFGVVLESPFGAIPFFWFLGMLLAKPVVAPKASAVGVAVEPELAGVR